YLNGIIQNKWFHRSANRSEGMLHDEDSKFLTGDKLSPEDDTSPRNFNGSTIGDELRLASGIAPKSISLALKERGAILLGGRTGHAYFFSEPVGEMTSSTYYMQQLPDWATQFNAQKLPDKSFGQNWTRALPVGAYTLAGADDSPYEGDVLG